MKKHPRLRTKKCWKPSALARWLTLAEISALLLCSIPSLVEGRSTRDISDSNSTTPNDCNDLCFTEDCIHTASAILENMDPDVDPCVDFYRYACGGYINKTILEDKVEKLNSLLSGSITVNDQLKSVIQTDIKPDAPRHFKIVKNVYDICMNETAIKEAGNEPLFRQLKKFGGWPVLLGDAWNENNFSWIETIYKFRDAGYSNYYLITSGVDLDFKDNSKYVMFIDQVRLEISRSSLLNGTNNTNVKNYYNEMVGTAVRLGAPEGRAQKEMGEALAFEMQLANITASDEERREVTQLYNLMSIKVLSERYPSVPWREYFNRMLTSPMTVGEDEVVIVGNPNYFTQLEKLLAETPKRIVANYLLWRAIKPSLNYLENPSYKRNSDDCTKEVINNFEIITSAMYVRKHFSEEAKQNAIEMVEDMRRQVIVILDELDWMDNDTKIIAMEKARTMVSHVGYPDELLDDNKLEKYYEKLDISGDSYLDTMLKISHFYEDLSWSRMHRPVNLTEWTTHANSASVDAYALYNQNGFQIPAGILQGFFFNINRPNYMNYGAIGYAIGHEITHNFDDIGKHYDKNGNLHDWWVPKTEARYRQRVQCLLEQYGNYTVPEIGLKLKAENTQGENISDNGGIKIAYLAYKSWVARNKPEAQLPGVNRTPEQMFWLSAANVWCAKSTLGSLKNEVDSDQHSPERFRILGVFSNMPEFANDYNCSVGSPMNPPKKCSVW